MQETVDLAVNRISSNVALHPTESITDGFFRQRHRGLAILIYEYAGEQVTWYLLYLLLLGIEYWTSQLGRSTELRFDVDVEGEGRVGYGSLWDVVRGGSNIARRAVNATTQQWAGAEISKLALTNSTDSVPSSIPNEGYLVFSYHFFGTRIPEPGLSAYFRAVRRSISLNVQYHPLVHIPDGRFRDRTAESPFSVTIDAYARKTISWLLLDRILSHVEADLGNEGLLRECRFEFEIAPVMDPHGHGSVRYSPVRSERSRRTVGK